MDLTVVIPFYNGHAHIEAALASLPSSLPVIVVDDCSAQAFATSRPNVRVLRLEKKGYFAGAVNAGIAACQTDVLVLNQDISLRGERWLTLLAENRAQYAMIGEKIKGDHPAWQNGYIQGTFMFIRRDAWRKVGTLDAVNFPLWGGTADWQVRACRAGYRALPLADIPGFTHDRKQRRSFGSSIRQLLRAEPEKYDWFIRTPPLVSVIVPCYNYGRYLPDAVNSLIGGDTSLGPLRQTFQAFEVIIVDDFSTDETPEIGAALADHWKGVKYIRHKRRMGTSAVNNTGLRTATGRAVTTLAADDMYEPWRLETLYQEWAQDPGKVYYDDIQRFAGGERRGTMPMQEYDFSRLIWKNQMHAGIFLSRAAAEDVGGWPEEMVYGREDWAMNVRLGLAGYCGRRVAQPGYLYRREGQGRSERNTTPQWRSRFMMQVQSLFPEAYNKEKWPMSCCGRGQSKSVRSTKGVSQMAKVTSLSGSAGMTLLEYTGASFGALTYFGPATGQAYRFGKSRPRGYVDSRDLRSGNPKAPGLLEMRESDRAIFRVVEPEKLAQTPAALDVPQAEAEAVNSGLIEPAQEQAGDEMLVAVLDQNAATVVDWLADHADGLGKDALQELRDHEAGNKSRKSVLAALDERLNA